MWMCAWTTSTVMYADTVTITVQNQTTPNALIPLKATAKFGALYNKTENMCSLQSYTCMRAISLVGLSFWVQSVFDILIHGRPFSHTATHHGTTHEFRRIFFPIVYALLWVIKFYSIESYTIIVDICIWFAPSNSKWCIDEGSPSLLPFLFLSIFTFTHLFYSFDRTKQKKIEKVQFQFFLISLCSDVRRIYSCFDLKKIVLW